MSTKTTNFELVKPGLDDLRDIGVLNSNFDIIDTAIFARALKTEAIKGIARDNLTFTATRCDGTTFTFDQKDTTYDNATQSAAGLMSSTDKAKLDGVAANANNYSLPLAASGTRGGVKIGYSQNNKKYPVQLDNEKMYVEVPWTDHTYDAATTNAAGLMSAADKTKLNGIASGANNYTLPTASGSTLGGVKTGYQQNDKNYPVQLDSNSKMYVSVPWQNVPENISAFNNNVGYLKGSDLSIQVVNVTKGTVASSGGNSTIGGNQAIGLSGRTAIGVIGFKVLDSRVFVTEMRASGNYVYFGGTGVGVAAGTNVTINIYVLTKPSTSSD